VHGIADFLVTDRASGRAIPITSRFRRVKALWNILSEAKLRSGFIGWWGSYPAEPALGYLVTDLLGFSMTRPGGAKETEGITWPPEYFSEIRPRLVLPDQIPYEEVARILAVSREAFAAARDVKLPDAPAPDATPAAQEPVWHVRKILAASRNYETIALDLLGKEIDVVAVYLEGIDMMGHRFQHCQPPRMAICPDAEFALARDAINNFYRHQDALLGRLLAAAPNRTVLIVSDHGFRSGKDRPPTLLPYTTGQPVEWHREEGVLVLSGPGARVGARLAAASVFDVAPTILHLLGLPAGEDMPGRVLVEAIDPRDLDRSPPRRIPSYEETGPPREIPRAVSSPEAQAEMVAALQALGYVGPVGAGDAGAAGTEVPRPTGGETALGDPEATRVTYHRNLATYLMNTGRLEEAEVHLRRANTEQSLPKTHELLSEIAAERGDIEGAIAHLEEGLRRFPAMDEEAALWIVELNLRRQRLDLAEEALARWRPRLTRPAIVSACEGKIDLGRGDEEGALAKFLRAIAVEPSLSQAAVAAAPLLGARGRLGELEQPITRALASEWRLDEYQNLLGLIRLEQGRLDESIGALGSALDVSPANPRFLENFASAALAAGRGSLAVDRYREATVDPRANGAVWSGYGRILGTERRPGEAAEAFEKALALGERSPATYAGLAASLYESGRRQRSREVLSEGLQVHPQDPALRALERSIEHAALG
jgi:tetratricopeptide (TPR) repeat protein